MAYSEKINRNISSDYDKFLKEKASEITSGQIKLDPLDYYTGFNNCNRKKILFSFPKDSIIVMEKNMEDDYAGTIVNNTSFYKKNKVFFFKSTNKGMDSLSIDSNYIFNNKENNGYTYKYILQLKNEKNLQTKSFTQVKCNPLQDITYVSLIVNQKLKKIYRICSGEMVEL